MKISVIIPTYNRATFLQKAIESILNQSVKVDEIIVIDDGSIDNTKEIIKKYNIKYIYQKNQGVSSARNTGIQNATNEWICFLDSDDIWEKDKIKIQIDYHKQNKNILFSYTDELWIFNNKIIKQNKKQQKNNNNNFLDHIDICKIGTSTIMINQKIFKKVGYFDETLKACEDYDLWLRILSFYKIGYIDKKLTKKIAGHKGQLSFETVGIDYYRILSLQKHIKTKYQKEILKQINKKKEILLKGAKKYNNKFFIDFCTNL